MWPTQTEISFSIADVTVFFFLGEEGSGMGESVISLLFDNKIITSYGFAHFACC